MAFANRALTGSLELVDVDETPLLLAVGVNAQRPGHWTTVSAKGRQLATQSLTITLLQIHLRSSVYVALIGSPPCWQPRDRYDREGTMISFAHPFLVGTLAVILMYFYWVKTKRRVRSPVDVVTAWIPLAPRGRRVPISSTPPRSLSPAKAISPTIPLGFWDAFPPSGREVLGAVAQELPETQKTKWTGKDVDQATFESNLIPFTADFATCGPSTYTPTRLSTDEIKALGDFPNYAELSGVPLPKPYEGFRIETALSRPYRPLRWAYHQTMCMLAWTKKLPNFLLT